MKGVKINNSYSVCVFVCVSTSPCVLTDHEEWPMELGFSSRVMVQCVTAVVSEVPLTQFTATLRNLCFSLTWQPLILLLCLRCPWLSLLLLSGICVSPWHDSPWDNLCAHNVIVGPLHRSMHYASCLLLYSMPILGESDKWTLNFELEQWPYYLQLFITW